MRAAFIADLHIANHQAHGGPPVAGINRRCQLALDTLQLAVYKANKLECTHLVVLGDLYDTTRPLPQIETAVARRLRSFDGSVLLLMGNHDRNSGLPGDHALGPLDDDRLQVVAEPIAIGELGLLPFRPEPVMSWFAPEAKKLFDRGARFLGAHFGLHDAAMRAGAKWMDECADAAPVEWVGETLEEIGLDRLFCGNWHSHRSWPEHRCVQVGSLVPTGWDNEGLDGYGKLVEFQLDDTGAELGVHEIPGPRFVKLKHGEKLWPSDLQRMEAGCSVFVRVVAKPEEHAAALEAAAATEGLAGYEVVIDTDAAREAAHQSAEAARKLDSLGDMANEYVSGLSLPAEARRDEILRLVRRYIEA